MFNIYSDYLVAAMTARYILAIYILRTCIIYFIQHYFTTVQH